MAARGPAAPSMPSSPLLEAQCRGSWPGLWLVHFEGIRAPPAARSVAGHWGHVGLRPASPGLEEHPRVKATDT